MPKGAGFFKPIDKKSFFEFVNKKNVLPCFHCHHCQHPATFALLASLQTQKQLMWPAKLLLFVRHFWNLGIPTTRIASVNDADHFHSKHLKRDAHPCCRLGRLNLPHSSVFYLPWAWGRPRSMQRQVMRD